MELVHIDYLTIEAPEDSRSSKDINILIITDHFTRYAQAHITSSQKAHVVAKLYGNTSLFTMAFQKRYYHTNVIILKVC